MGRTAQSIASDIRVHRALKAFGWNGRSDPEDFLAEYARRRLSHWLDAELQKGTTVDRLSDIVRIAADRLKVSVVEVETDAALDQVVDAYCKKKEFAFATIKDEMAADVEGAIVRLKHAEPWERPLVAMIDARGARGAARYFSQCHELAHPFVEPQMEFSFRCRSAPKDPLERAVDIVAGEIGFFRPLAARLLLSYASADCFQHLADDRRVKHQPSTWGLRGTRCNTSPFTTPYFSSG